MPTHYKSKERGECMSSEIDREEVVKKIYENLGVSDCYNPDGGIGFGLLKSGLLGSHMVILKEEAYQVLCCARRKTDETGIEYPFIIMGWYIENNGDFILLCNDGMMDENSININNGRCKMSNELTRQVSEQINQKEYGFTIICHTHPNHSQASFDRTTYDRLLPYQSRLAVRDLGLNISNGDISQLIGLKKQQFEHNNNCYFLQGISLPNGEFNIIDIDSFDQEPLLVSLPRVMRIIDDELVDIDNSWNKTESVQSNIKNIITK